MLKFLGRLFGIVALLGMLLGFVPLFGWFNWINIPLAIIGLLFSAIGKSKGGLTISAIAILFGLLRLILGGGII
jgi:uncharacterized membrane-anchored protein YitT (DUF2179 family)